jgi:hypothetical protein
MTGREASLALLFSLLLAAVFMLRAWAQMPGARSELVKDPTYADLSEKEHCIGNLTLSCQERSLERFEELLHPNYEYVHHSGTRFDREFELRSTKTIFETSSKVNMQIGEGEWAQINEESGAACSGCWETIRDFSYVAVSTKVKGGKSEITNARLRLVVAPIEEGGTIRYKLRVFELRKSPSE